MDSVVVVVAVIIMEIITRKTTKSMKMIMIRLHTMNSMKISNHPNLLSCGILSAEWR
jgi:hypothetical protein